jgi:hypothetical protein
MTTATTTTTVVVFGGRRWRRQYRRWWRGDFVFYTSKYIYIYIYIYTHTHTHTYRHYAHTHMMGRRRTNDGPIMEAVGLARNGKNNDWYIYLYINIYAYI